MTQDSSSDTGLEARSRDFGPLVVYVAIANDGLAGLASIVLGDRGATQVQFNIGRQNVENLVAALLWAADSFEELSQ
jgi:hypothetical protein